jgi:hypothetical protein
MQITAPLSEKAARELQIARSLTAIPAFSTP